MSDDQSQPPDPAIAESAPSRKASSARRLKLALKRGLRRNEEARYPIERSPLWRLQSPHQLARLLGLPLPRLLALEEQSHYRHFLTRTGGKSRSVDEPLGIRLRVHYRLARLLDRVERAPYLHSATPGRSHVSNAKAHAKVSAAHRVLSTDLVKFYPNTSAAKLKRFFSDTLHWPHDMARLMANVCTVNGHLPLGSCISPLLSYLVHKPAFDAIAEHCKSRQLVFTVFVDNLTVSGPGASQTLLYEIKQMLLRHGLRSHDDSLSAPGCWALVTGASLCGDQLQLPTAARLKIVQRIDGPAHGPTSAKTIRSIKGQIAAAGAVDAPLARNLHNRLGKTLLKRDDVGGV